jgi:hypothetical protein
MATHDRVDVSGTARYLESPAEAIELRVPCLFSEAAAPAQEATALFQEFAPLKGQAVAGFK